MVSPPPFSPDFDLLVEKRGDAVYTDRPISKKVRDRMTELYEDEQPESQDIPLNSVFHPDNVGPVTLLTLLHIKDYLNVIAGKLDPNTTDHIQELHENGHFLCPAPVAKVSGPTGE